MGATTSDCCCVRAELRDDTTDEKGIYFGEEKPKDFSKHGFYNTAPFDSA